MSDTQIESIIQSKLKLDTHASRSEREVSGYIRALKFINENSGKIELSEKILREIHLLLTYDLTEDQLPSTQRGIYKDIVNNVVEINNSTGCQTLWLKTNSPGYENDQAMTSLFESYSAANKENVHHLINTSIFIVRLLAIHPFRDGNGRLSRLITALLLLQKYPWTRFVSHEMFIEENKETYYVSLRNSQITLSSSHENFDSWIEFFLSIVCQQIKLLEQKLHLDNLSNPKFKLTRNEQDVIDYLKRKGPSATKDINKKIKISPQGIKILLKRLLEHRLVEKLGGGPSTVYRAN
ncbi:MAG: Fic family protein [Proteobacteria bacterium]|nr:MAG: Fic family protein [Pseudomonadota bacterium]